MYVPMTARPLDRPSTLGMGCVECEGTCGGLGLFESWNPMEWGWHEWLTAIGVAYIASSLLFTSSSIVKAGQGIRRDRRKMKAAYYRKRAAELSR